MLFCLGGAGGGAAARPMQAMPVSGIAVDTGVVFSGMQKW